MVLNLTVRLRGERRDIQRRVRHFLDVQGTRWNVSRSKIARQESAVVRRAVS